MAWVMRTCFDMEWSSNRQLHRQNGVGISMTDSVCATVELPNIIRIVLIGEM